MSDLSATEMKLVRLRAVIAAIEPGCAISYAEVARRAGVPRGARLAVQALRGAGDLGLPWHRVIRADGRIAFPAGSVEWVEQSERLRAEGVQVIEGRVKLVRRTDPLDEQLWAPD